MKPPLADLPAVVLVNPKYAHNVASAIRALSCFGVTDLFWTGSRVDPTTMSRLPREERMRGYKAVNWTRMDKPFDHMPADCVPVCVEVFEHSEPLTIFKHPENAVYVFGPEDGAVPQVYRNRCHRFVHIPSHHCLNLAAALNVLLYDRRMKRQLNGVEPIVPLAEMLHEHRGAYHGPIDIDGWDGSK